MNKLRSIAAAVLAVASLSAHAVGHLADVTIVDRASGRQIPVHWKDGRVYVVGRPGAGYQVTVRNTRGEDVLAVVSVDGLNVMNGETANPRQSGYVISPWNRVDVRGWRKSMDEVAAFYFTSLGDSYAARTDRPNNVGVIGVALFQRKREPVYVPDVSQSAPAPWEREKDSKARSETSNDLLSRAQNAPSSAGRVATMPPPAMPAPSAPLGTGHGQREESRVRWVEFERATEQPAETIAIYYDSYENLVALGVVRPAPSPRDPNPFPMAFAPDPWR
jgi:hypothetical protein